MGVDINLKQSNNDNQIDTLPEDILHELAQCREDERASKSQIFQILSTTATFLTIVTTISGALNSSNSEEWKLYMFLYLLTIFLVSATVTYITNLGFLSTFRHHYMVDLENRLNSDASKQILHWETVSKPVITLNPKHIGTGFFSLFSINARIALVSMLFLALTFIIMQISIILNRFPKLSTIAWCGFMLYVLVLSICTLTLVVSMYKAKEIYQQALEKVSTKPRKRSSIGAAIAYYIYPRLKDSQKILFIVFGYVTGHVLSYIEQATIPSIWENIPDLLVILFIIDGLVYQARYLWNDIRGANEDYSHPLKKKRGRLPTDTLGFNQAVYIALTVMGLRMVAAIICIFLLGPTKWIPMSASCTLILVLGVAYEVAREKEKSLWTIFLVCLGYPLRWVAGLWCAYPSLIDVALDKKVYFCFLLTLLISIGAFGGAFVSMTWVLEAVHIYQEGRPIHKPHLQLLFHTLNSVQQHADHPLLEYEALECLNKNSRLKYLQYLKFPKHLWDIFYMLSTTFSTISIVVFFFPDWSKCWIALLTGILCSIPLTFQDCSKDTLIVTFCSLLLHGFFTLIIMSLSPTWILFILVELLQFAYLCVYISFRRSNYTELYSVIGNLLSALRNFAKKLNSLVLYALLGKNTLDKLKRDK